MTNCLCASLRALCVSAVSPRANEGVNLQEKRARFSQPQAVQGLALRKKDFLQIRAF